MHVLTRVLKGTHRSLKADGVLLIIQPGPMFSTVQLTVDGSIVCSRKFGEPNFYRYLDAAETAIKIVLSERCFALDHRVEVEQGLDHDSIDDWVASRAPFCEDPEAFESLLAEMRNHAGGREHHLLEYWPEHRILLRKQAEWNEWSEAQPQKEQPTT